MSSVLEESESNRLRAHRRAVEEYISTYEQSGWCSELQLAIARHLAPHCEEGTTITPRMILAWMRAPVSACGVNADLRIRVQEMLREILHENPATSRPDASTLASRYAAAMLSYSYALDEIGIRAVRAEGSTEVDDEYKEMQQALECTARMMEMEAHRDHCLASETATLWRQQGFVGNFSSSWQREEWASTRVQDGNDSPTSFSQNAFIDDAVAASFDGDFSDSGARERWAHRHVFDGLGFASSLAEGSAGPSSMQSRTRHADSTSIQADQATATSCEHVMATTAAFREELQDAFLEGRPISVQLPGFPCRWCKNPGLAQCMCESERLIEVEQLRDMTPRVAATGRR